MLPLEEDPHFAFRFAEARIIPRFHLEGVGAGRRVSVFQIDLGTQERLGLVETATVGEGGWVDLLESIIVRPGCDTPFAPWTRLKLPQALAEEPSDDPFHR